MADVDPGDSAFDSEALAATLAGPFSDPEARERRARNLAEDARDSEAVAAIFAPLDTLIASFVARVAELQAEEAAAIELQAEDVVEVIDERGADLVELQSEDDDLAGAADAPDAAPPPLAADFDPEATEEIVDELLDDVDPVDVTSGRRRHRRQAADLLYEDMLWLLSINDGEGALISLERLLASHPVVGELKQFIELNLQRLLNLYKETIFGSLDKVPLPAATAALTDMPLSYRTGEKLGVMLKLIDGRRDIAKLVEVAPYSPLETCCVVNQLRRSGLITL